MDAIRRTYGRWGKPKIYNGATHWERAAGPHPNYTADGASYLLQSGSPGITTAPVAHGLPDAATGHNAIWSQERKTDQGRQQAVKLAWRQARLGPWEARRQSPSPKRWRYIRRMRETTMRLAPARPPLIVV